MTATRPDRPARAERWRIDAGAAESALLHVPPVLRRDRTVEIDVRSVTRVGGGARRERLVIEAEVDQPADG